MTHDVGLELVPDGNGGITLTFTDGGANTVLTRAMPAFDNGLLDALRRGDPTQNDVSTLISEVSLWVLGQDLGGPIKAVLDAQKPVRVVVRLDPGLPPLLDLPLELTTFPLAVRPLVLQPDVRAFVYVPAAVPPIPTAPVGAWPLRVLLVRSNPEDLGGAVPPIAPVRRAILDAATDAGVQDGAVQVELVSSEEQGSEPVTFARFREAIGSQSFDVLVYLGHGAVAQVATAPVGQLQFELPGGHEAVDAGRIAAELQAHPIRVVILAGCLTAAQVLGVPQDVQELIRTALPQWQRGAQGVAQALVETDARVELAVGMRGRLEVEQASTFLVAFFKSLVQTSPGDVELAVRAARNELFGNSPVPPAWSSPVVFVKSVPPVFGFMTEPLPQVKFSAEKQTQLDKTRAIRQFVATQFVDAVGDRAPWIAAFAAAATAETAVLKKEPMVRPCFISAPPGPVRMEIELVGSVKAIRLEGTVTIGTDGASIDRMLPDPRLEAAGFQFLRADDGSQKARFVIERQGPAAKLAAGRLFTIDVTLPTPPPAVHEVVVSGAQSDPPRVIWSGMDVVAVVP